MRKEILKQKKEIECNENMKKSLEILHEYINEYGIVKTFDYLHEIMRKSQPFIEDLLDKRKEQNQQYDKDQARKTIAGNIFQFLVLYLLILNIEQGNLPENLIVLKTKKHRIVDEYANIRVGDDTQKPDLDLIAFTEDEEKEDEEKPVIVYSCKTSLRERAGQTYRWKLLVDITKNCPELVKKYQLEYPKKRKIFTGFITTNFYNEIMQPQQKGMLKFFDYSYIAKDIDIDIDFPMKKLSSIIEDLKKIFT